MAGTAGTIRLLKPTLLMEGIRVGPCCVTTMPDFDGLTVGRCMWRHNLMTELANIHVGQPKEIALQGG